MSTIAGFLDRFAIGRAAERAASAHPARDERSNHIRKFASEEIFFYAKPIDNSRIVRQADPQAGRSQTLVIVTSLAAAITLVAIMLPALTTHFAGYKLRQLQEERQVLLAEKTALDLEEAKLVEPGRLQELARKQSFVDPDPRKVVYLDLPSSGATVAKRTDNRKEQDR